MTAPLLSFQLLPERASDLARSVDAIFWSLIALCGLFGILLGEQVVPLARHLIAGGASLL